MKSQIFKAPGLPPRCINAVLSDLDGTLVNSGYLLYDAVNHVLREFGIEIHWDAFKMYTGRGPNASSAMLKDVFCLPLSPEEITEKRITAFMEILPNAEVNPLPGAKELLELLNSQKIPVAVASASPRIQIAGLLAKAELIRYVSRIMSGHDDVRRTKPAPDVYLAAAKALNVPIQNCLILEDSETGVQAAKASGALVIAVPCAAHPDNCIGEADLVLDSLTSLLPMLEISQTDLGYTRERIFAGVS